MNYRLENILIKAVVFDLDDTLISEAQYQLSANLSVLNYLSDLTGLNLLEISMHSEDAIKAGRSQYFQNLLPMLGISADQELIDELISVHRGHLPDVDLYPDVLDTLNDLRNMDARLGVITDGYSIAQHQKLNAINASKYFDAIVVSDDLGREFWKPHPKPFKEIATQLGIDPQELIYVGDNPEKDFHISHTLGIKTARIIRDDSIKSTRPYRDNIKEDYFLESLFSIVELYRQLRQDRNEKN